jgi:hypothetical protein
MEREHPVRNFPKIPHRIYREDSCIMSLPHATDPQKPKCFFDFHDGFYKKIRAGQQVLIVAILT